MLYEKLKKENKNLYIKELSPKKNRSLKRKCTVECNPSLLIRGLSNSLTKDTVINHPNQDSIDRYEVIYVD